MLTRISMLIAAVLMTTLSSGGMAWAQQATELKEPAAQPPGLKESAPQRQELKESAPQGTVPQSTAPAAMPPVASIGANVAGGVSCPGQGPCMVEATDQPLRILPRSLAPLYAQPDDSVAPASDAVASFKPAYVFQRQGLDFSQPAAPQGWYQVGYTTRAPIGWMRARDVLEWRQALLLAYTHPGKGKERRNPVLMFESKNPLQEIVTAGNRKERSGRLYATLRDGRKPEHIIGKESNRFLKIDESFYLLPVLQWEQEEAFDESSHYLQVFAAVPGARAAKQGEGTLQDPKTLREQAKPGAPNVGRLDVDIKFVVDMTGSMQPSISQVSAAMTRIAERLLDVDPGQASVRFGLVGYRDDVSKTPALEWTTRNFTPDLVDGKGFRDLLINGGKNLVASVSSDEWAEDVFAGYKLGLDSPWTSATSVKLMFLIGDASGHREHSVILTPHREAFYNREKLVNHPVGKDSPWDKLRFSRYPRFVQENNGTTCAKTSISALTSGLMTSKHVCLTRQAPYPRSATWCGSYAKTSRAVSLKRCSTMLTHRSTTERRPLVPSVSGASRLALP